ncbi:MAG: PAC2 family protein [Thermoprotei archaeon]
MSINYIGRPRREIVYDGIVFHEYYDPFTEPAPTYLVLGLPDAGLVGSIASRYLVINKKFKLVGEIDSPVFFPYISVVHRSIPLSPVQLYASEDRRVLVLLSEIPIPVNAVYPLAKAIIEYSKDVNIGYIISLAGLAVPNRMQLQKPRVYWLASTTTASELAKKAGIEELKEGFIVGPYAVIIKEARRRGVNNLVLFAESFLDIPDPESAAEALKALSTILDMEIDLKQLLEEAELLKLKTRELMLQTKRTMGEMQKRYEMQLPLMYQ